MQKYPIGIQDFRELRQGGYLYVDKTGLIDQIISSGKYFFLSRPRRFGKSLLLSTIKYLFQGERNLFEGLKVETREDWTPHPVIHFSFSTLAYKSMGLEAALLQALDIEAQKHQITLSYEGLSPRFQQLIQSLGSGAQKLVVLIDEYDKPLVDYIDDIPQAAMHRDIMKSFFSAVKDSDAYLRLFLLTGVSKFSKVSLFSDLNHLEDLTLAPAAATLIGYTQAELDAYFEDELTQLGSSMGLNRDEIRERVRMWYNGYLWAGNERLYNPFSILNLVKQQRFQNFWWETGTPSFLIKKLRAGFHYDLEKIEAGSALFESYTLENMEWRSLLFQTGYLTLKGYDEDLQLYTLGYPNREVKDAMYQHLLSAFRHSGVVETKPLYANLKRALDQRDFSLLVSLIDQLFSTIPYQLFISEKEAFFHAVLHLTFSGLGLLTQSEVNMAHGRVDTVVHTRDCIYVMEFKLDQSAAAALNQIRNTRYGSPWLGQGKEVVAIGINFSSETRAVAEWEVADYATLLSQG